MIADNTQAAECRSLAELNVIDNTKWEIDEDGMTNRPCIQVTATLCHETEDFIRSIKTLADIMPIYMRALRGTYDSEEAVKRYAGVSELFHKLREEISKDLGYCIGDRLEQWQADYL